MSTRRRRRAEEPSSSAAAAETTKGGKATWFWEAGGRLVETRRPVTAEPMSGRYAEEAEDEEWIVSDDNALPLIPSSRPLPRRCPKFPDGGSMKEISEWNKACDRVYKLAVNDPVTHPPLLRETKDDFDTSSSSTSDELYCSSSRHREMILGLARSIVSISSTENDGLPEWNFNGIIIGPSESDERARILTSSETVCDYEGKLNHKLLVRLPSKVIKDGELLFFDHHYGLAVLEISVDMLLQCPPFVSSPDYGDDVFVLTRKEDSSLMTTAGKVLWHNEPYFGRNHYLYLSCDLPERISGALVMDRDGNIAGITFDCPSPKTAVLPSFIIKKLIEMESNFRYMARPEHGLSLRAVQFLDISRKEEILYKHNIDSGYLVDQVKIKSTAEIIGIRRGDVIVSVNGMRSLNMLELEEYFLSLGQQFLEKKIESSKIVLKLKVYDPLNCQEHTLCLPLGFSCLKTVKERVKVQVTEKISPAIKGKKMPSGRVLRPRKTGVKDPEDSPPRKKGKIVEGKDAQESVSRPLKKGKRVRGKESEDSPPRKKGKIVEGKDAQESVSRPLKKGKIVRGKDSEDD